MAYRQRKKRGRQRTPDGCSNRSQRTSQLHTHKRGGIQSNRPRRHLGNRHDIRKFLKRQPVVFRNNLLLNDRQHSVPAAKAEQSNLQEAPKKLPVNHGFRASSLSFNQRLLTNTTAPPKAPQARITQMTLILKKYTAQKEAIMINVENVFPAFSTFAAPVITTSAIIAAIPACIPFST